MIMHIQAKIQGRVQGVFFRESMRKKAEELGVAGFVRNQDDGTVYLEAEAENDTMERFVSWLKQGPPAAEVSKVDLERTDKTRGFQGFKVAY